MVPGLRRIDRIASTPEATMILGFIALMNLLPIPALDGGLIILSLLEGVRKKPLKPKFIYRFQIVGFLIIFILLATALLSDILFFVS